MSSTTRPTTVSFFLFPQFSYLYKYLYDCIMYIQQRRVCIIYNICIFYIQKKICRRVDDYNDDDRKKT